MAHLVLFLDNEADWADLPTIGTLVTRDEAAEVVAGLGDIAIFTASLPSGRRYFATAALTALLPLANGSPVLRLAIADFAMFDAAIAIPGKSGSRVLPISDQLYAQIVEHPGFAQPPIPNTGNLSEQQAQFLAGAPGIDDYGALFDAVARASGYRCAITGTQFAEVRWLDSGLDIVAIRPRAAGGALHVSNYLALRRDAHEAFVRGRIAVGPNFELLANVTRLPVELYADIGPGRFLRLPADRALWPAAENLDYHRRTIFGAV